MDRIQASVPIKIMPHPLLKIYSANYYGWFNKGDAALVMAHVDALKRNLPDAEIVLASDTPEVDASRYNLKVVAPVYIPWRGISFKSLRRRFMKHIGWRLPSALQPTGSSRLWIWLSMTTLSWTHTLELGIKLVQLWWRVRVLKKSPVDCFTGSARESVKELLDATAVIFVPGGYLMSFKPNETSWYMRIFPIFLAKLAKIPVILAPMSIGPFIGLRNRVIAKQGLRMVDKTYLRERSSLRTLKKLNICDERIAISADAAFALLPRPLSVEESEPLHQVEARKGFKVGVSARNYDFPASNNPAERRAKYVKDMAFFLDYIIKNHAASIWIMPQVTLPGRDDDLIISRQIIKEMTHTGSVTLIEENDLSPPQLQRLYQSMNVFVGVRMHANIFALSRNIPTLAIAYQKKTQGIMESLDLSDWVIDIYDLTREELIKKFEKLMQRRFEVSQSLPDRIKKKRDIVDSTYVDIASLVRGANDSIN